MVSSKGRYMTSKNIEKKQYLQLPILVLFVIICVVSFVSCSEQKESDEEYEYEIERVFPDDTFISIIEGNTLPKEIVVGFGGENGYEQFSTKDPAMIDAYIRAFRNVIIEEEITDKDKMCYVADGVIDYIFMVDDDTEITIGTDLTEYITDRNRGIQFHLGNTEQFNNLNKKLWQ
ncbi:MAG: hypothetical protein K5662_01775 [Lachnospiraceae bacterium]|nr:hypothetical protein [Lachnospiraceae bacterium]